MYAIAFDLDDDKVKNLYTNPSTGVLAPQSYKNAWAAIGTELKSFGFDHQQGSVYFGTEKVNAVTCVLAVQHLAKKFAWFAPGVKDIRMLRIEYNNDLMPAIAAVAPAQAPQTSAGAQPATGAAP